MATKTIFQLSDASLNVTNTDLLMLGQSGTLRKVTFANFLTSFNDKLLPVLDLSVLRYTVDYQPTPDTISTTTTLTAANLQKRILLSNPAAGITLTFPTGTTIETAATIGVDQAVTFSIVNTNATNAITLAGNTGSTYIGNTTLAANSSASFRIRKTATNTFTIYRV